MEKTWADFYGYICGSRKMLEGNILEHAPFITEIIKHVKVGDKVLEIGSGTGVMGYSLAQAGVEVISIDNDREILTMGQINAGVLGAKIIFQYADAFHLPFEDRAFKVAFSLGLLEHFSDEDIGLLIAEHQRVADVVVVGMPIKGNKSPAFGNERYLTMEEWEALLQPMGACLGFTYGHEICVCFSFIRVSFPSPLKGEGKGG